MEVTHGTERSATSGQLPGARTGREAERSIRRGPRRVPAEFVAANQRDRLLDGVARTVAERGYAGARISDICRAAGVTRPVFYELFAGKEHAVLSAYRAGTALVVARMAEAYETAGGGADWPAAVRAGLRTLLDLLAETPPFAAMLVEIEAVGPAGRRARARLLAEFRRFFADAPPGPVGIPGAELTDALIGGVHAALYRWIDEDHVSELPGLLDTLVFLVVAPFGTASRPPRPSPTSAPPHG
ncbi:TetR/AcrR family transcriptional regulator [Streptomyces odontomachi]|uniref:TetR/AcrR family transcriptional regulator n=1 Tax=Streptomyces odontomachi TaxID=2944940 RepID=UPI00210B3EDF|nr:TetR/AcrR family transcriptional regulator [Streptomyces sp. ODS25]